MKTFVKDQKLTEKGRDSYRKMHAWVYDERAIAMLKTLIPRKSELVRTATSTSSALQAQLLAQDKEGIKRRYETMSHMISEAGNYRSHSPQIPFSHEVSRIIRPSSCSISGYIHYRHHK